METNWAAEHLHTIRTLMERSALYRRALAPVTIVTGSIGLLASIVPCFVKIQAGRAFSLFWIGVALLAVLASFLLVRRQALKEAEPFWSLPTRRVSQALLPGFLVGLAVGILFVIDSGSLSGAVWVLPLVWIVSYGCALHAAGFFVQRGIKLFGWAFILAGCAMLFACAFTPQLRSAEVAHYLMGTFFGVFHLAYGTYLYFTEKGKNAA